METRLPVERSLSVIPDHDILILGVRELVLSLLVGGVLFSISARWSLVLWLVAGLLVLVVPLTLGGLAWPVALVGLNVYLTQVKRASVKKDKPVPAVSIAFAVTAAVTAVSLARFTDPPLNFAVGKVVEKAADPSPTWRDPVGSVRCL
jgi:hypothetical protein